MFIFSLELVDLLTEPVLEVLADLKTDDGKVGQPTGKQLPMVCKIKFTNNFEVDGRHWPCRGPLLSCIFTGNRLYVFIITV